MILKTALNNLKSPFTGGNRLIVLAGDASTRRYYRIVDDSRSYVLQMAEPFAGKNEFLKVQAFLAEKEIPVPRVFAWEPADGAVLLEDLGDVTMSAALADDPSREQSLFQNAMSLLARLHQYAVPETKMLDAPSGFGLAFDEEKLMWEVGFTIEHFYHGALGKELTTAEKDLVLEQFGQICRILAAEPRVFTHRDYHTRNLMVTKQQMFMIDFQDARMGPRQYDLASLLRDSYYQLEDQKVEAMIDYYWDCCRRLGSAPTDVSHFKRIFDLMSIQRNFKALGTFGFQHSVKQKAYYLRFVGNTFENIRKNLAKFPQYKELARVLSTRYYL